MNQHEKLDLVIQQNTYILGLLENNEKTGRKGIAEQTEINTKDILSLKEDKKITAGKIGISATILTVVGGILLRLLGYIKFVF